MRKIVNADGLKCVALVAMTLDHMAAYGLLPPWVQFTIGRLAFPIFACLLTYHLYTKQLFKKYTERLLFWGTVTIFARSDYPLFDIFFTFLWPILALWGVQKLSQMRLPALLHNFLLEGLFVAGAIAAVHTSYDIYGFVYVCLWYFWWKKPNSCCACLLIFFGALSSITSMSPLCLASAAVVTAGLLFVLPGGRHWLKANYLFYPYFPAHVWVLSCWAKHALIVPHFPLFVWVWAGVYFALYILKKYKISMKSIDLKIGR